MGLTYTTITLLNSRDVSSKEAGNITAQSIRRQEVNILVDSGAYMLCINEHLRDQLGLHTLLHHQTQLANNALIGVDVVGPIEVRLMNRSTICFAMVLPGNAEPLLGAIPMEQLKVIIDPVEQVLKLRS